MENDFLNAVITVIWLFKCYSRLLLTITCLNSKRSYCCSFNKLSPIIYLHQIAGYLYKVQLSWVWLHTNRKKQDTWRT